MAHDLLWLILFYAVAHHHLALHRGKTFVWMPPIGKKKKIPSAYMCCVDKAFVENLFFLTASFERHVLILLSHTVKRAAWSRHCALFWKRSCDLSLLHLHIWLYRRSEAKHWITSLSRWTMGKKWACGLWKDKSCRPISLNIFLSLFKPSSLTGK